MKKRFFLSVFCLCAPILLISVFASEDAASPIVIRFAHDVAEDTPKGIGAQMFKKPVEQRLPGKVVVEISPRSEKFTDEEAIVAMLLGDVWMVAPSFPKFCRFSKALQVFDIPFMFEEVDKVHQFQQSESGQILLAAKQVKN